MLHAKSSAKKFGGKAEDYLPIHDMMDSSKSHIADPRHRLVFHTSFGCFIIEKIFGHVLVNSDGREVSVRDIAEQHILEDFHVAGYYHGKRDVFPFTLNLTPDINNQILITKPKPRNDTALDRALNLLSGDDDG